MSQIVKALKYWADHPVEAVKDWFGVTPEDYQAEALTALFGGKGRTAIKSAHGVGKTTTMSWAGWIFLITRPMSRVPATAPTANQLMDILWPEFSKWHYRMPEQLRDQFVVTKTHISHKKYGDTWFATARTSNKPENMQGFHGDHILVVVDEASGVAQNIYEVIEGILSNAGEHGQEARILMGGNPTQTSGEFYSAFHKNRKLYDRLTVSGDPDVSPGLILPGEKLFISKRVTQKYRDVMKGKYGDGPVYDVRVRGLFPRAADDAVIALEWAERAQYIKLPHFDDIADPITLVMDPARYGGNKTTLGVFRKGHCLAIYKWPKTSTNEAADILLEAFKYGGYGVGSIPVSAVIVDEPGVGGGVIDSAIRAGVPIIPYNGSAALIKGTDPDEHLRMFSNRRSRDWWMLRRKFEQSLSKIPEDEDIVNELASVKYEYVNEKIKVESKRDMIERLGEDASPDLADTLVMGLTPYIGVASEASFTADFDYQFGADMATADMDFGYGENPYS